MENEIKLIRIDEVSEIAKKEGMNKLEFLKTIGVRSAYYSAKSRGHIYLSGNVSIRIHEFMKKN